MSMVYVNAADAISIVGEVRTRDGEEMFTANMVASNGRLIMRVDNAPPGRWFIYVTRSSGNTEVFGPYNMEPGPGNDIGINLGPEGAAGPTAKSWADKKAGPTNRDAGTGGDDGAGSGGDDGAGSGWLLLAALLGAVVLR